MLGGWPKRTNAAGNLSAVSFADRGRGRLSGFPSLIPRRLDLSHRLSNGLVGWWPMDDGQGVIARDISRYGHAATLTNMASPGTPTSGWGGGPSQRELAWDGSNDTAIVAHASPLVLLGDLTWMCELYPVTYGNHHCLISKATVNWGNPFDMRLENGSGVITHCRGTASSNQCVSSSAVIPLNAWTHICATQLGSLVTFYVNGVANSTGSVTITPTDASGLLRMGVRVDSATKTNGRQRQTRLYNRALLAGEVAEIFANKWAGAI